MQPPRQLTFTRYTEVCDELRRLARGHQRHGTWSLPQTCLHLSFYYRGSLDGFGFRLPWLVRKLIGRPLLKRVLKRRTMKYGGQTVPKSVPPDDADAPGAVDEALALLARLEQATHLHPSPIFDALSVDEWRQLHLIHSAHHLCLFVPTEDTHA